MEVYVVKIYDENSKPVYRMRNTKGEILVEIFDEPGKTEDDIKYALALVATKANYKIVNWVGV